MKLYRTILLFPLIAACLLAPLSACRSDPAPSPDSALIEEPAHKPADDFSEPAEEFPDPVEPEPAESSSELLPETPTEPEPSPEPPSEPQPQTEGYIQVLVNGLNVRAGAGTGAAVLGQAEKGTLLPLSGRQGNWYETAYRGRTAYVSADSRYTKRTELARADEVTERVILEGAKLLGTPYVYGAIRLHDGKGHMLRGFTADRFDCSSLMQYIFYRGAGILLDVTTRTQIGQGVRVEPSALRRGDLMFFTNASRRNKTGIERVGHVALYLGENYILHTASDFAKIEQISAARWDYFLEGRRML